MKKLLKDKIYLSMFIGFLFSLITCITLLFVKERIYFTIIFILNVIMNFLVTTLSLLLDEKKNNTIRFKLIPLYLMTTLFFLILDIIIISNIWDLNIYSNLMYITNTKLYLGMYSVFVLFMVLLSIYVILKDRLLNNETNIRQKSAKR